MHNYNGFDFYELHKAFNLPDWEGIEPTSCGDYDSIVLKSYIQMVVAKSNYHWQGKDFVMRYTANHVRLFLRALYKDAKHYHKDDARLYKAMYKMKSDWSLLQWFGTNCEKCWN